MCWVLKKERAHQVVLAHTGWEQGDAEFPVLSLLPLFLPPVAVSGRDREEGALCQQAKQVFMQQITVFKAHPELPVKHC